MTRQRRNAVVLLHIITSLPLISIIGILLFYFAQLKLHIQYTSLVINHDQISILPVDEKTKIEEKTAREPFSINSDNTIPVDVTNIHEETTTAIQEISVPPTTSTTKAWSNVTTVAWKMMMYRSGFCNQMMNFVAFILNAIQNGHGQILLESITMKDTYGTGRGVAFDKIWDVSHFNSFYPQLPRIVDCDLEIHTQFHCAVKAWHTDEKGYYTDHDGNNPEKECTSPFADNMTHHWAQNRYMRYTGGKKTGLHEPNSGRHPADILMLQGALQPHPNLQKIVNLSLASLTHNMTVDFIALHARVEPDMQKHVTCLHKKVTNLTAIFRFMEATWPNPPAPHIFMPLNRQKLELEGYPNTDDPSKTNWIAVENLRALDDAKANGLWNGRARFFEFGANALKGTDYENHSSVSGSVLNYFISMEAKIFIGTEISSYSYFLMSSRFFRNNMETYKYLPDGIHSWTPPGTKTPDQFAC